MGMKKQFYDLSLKMAVKLLRDSQIEIHVNHPAYKASTALTTEQKSELIKDLS